MFSQVSGASLRVLSRRLDAEPQSEARNSRRVSETRGEGLPQGGAAAAVAGGGGRWRGWLGAGRLMDGSQRQMSRSQHRFVQMSTDLTTLRWSWCVHGVI